MNRATLRWKKIRKYFHIKKFRRKFTRDIYATFSISIRKRERIFYRFNKKIFIKHQQKSLNNIIKISKIFIFKKLNFIRYIVDDYHQICMSVKFNRSERCRSLRSSHNRTTVIKRHNRTVKLSFNRNNDVDLSKPTIIRCACTYTRLLSHYRNKCNTGAYKSRCFRWVEVVSDLIE